jgi:hypothetical protein
MDSSKPAPPDETATYMMAHSHHLTLLQRTAVLASWAVAGALFLTVGRMAMAPDDPQAAVSLLTRHGAASMILQTALLAGVVSGIATVLAGRFLPDIGVLAAAAGMTVVALRGATSTNLLLLTAEGSSATTGWLAARLAGESAGWFLVILAAMFVSAMVGRWLIGEGATNEEALAEKPLLAVSDVPFQGFRSLRPAGKTPADGGLKHTTILSISALIVLWILSESLDGRSVRHGQACFNLTVSICIGSYFAWRFSPVRSALWAILAVPLIAISSYILAALSPADPTLPASIPESHFLRILPIQYIGVGTVAAVATFWSGFRHHEPMEPATKPSKLSHRPSRIG